MRPDRTTSDGRRMYLNGTPSFIREEDGTVRWTVDKDKDKDKDKEASIRYESGVRGQGIINHQSQSPDGDGAGRDGPEDRGLR